MAILSRVRHGAIVRIDKRKMLKATPKWLGLLLEIYLLLTFVNSDICKSGPLAAISLGRRALFTRGRQCSCIWRMLVFHKY